MAKSFWIDKTNDFDQVTSFIEREEQLKKLPTMNLHLANPQTISKNSMSSYLEMLKGRRLGADQIIFNKNKTKSAYKNVALPLEDDFINDEQVTELVTQIDYQTQLKTLKMYYDMYMSETYSDIKWRLGSIKGTVEDLTKFDDDVALLNEGKNYTRSNMSMMYEKYYSYYGSYYKKLEVFSSLGFPPYKIGASNDISTKTSLMDSVLIKNPNAAFDQDNFTINREKFTLRDIGMKSLSDYINYLQWIIEGTCGVVSTYLTEWDLSVYIQEGLMQPQVNGTPTKIYLNYRIYEDNPLSDSNNLKYVNDKALVFNVCGSAVSKLEADNEKYWRPSDFPLSVWWTPYSKEKDWDLKNLELTLSEDNKMNIPYMSIYDEANPNFNYTSAKSILKILKNQDYIGTALATKPTEKLRFYDAFYTSPYDGLTDFDVKMKNILKRVSGAKAGEAQNKRLDLKYALTLAKQEMIMNGGYYGAPQQVGDGGGYMNRMFIKNAMEETNEPTTTSLALMQSESRVSDSSTLDSTDDLVKSSFSNSKDGSVMSKMVGINRFSPALYGGPHGSSYSLYNLKSFYETSLINRNIPRISLDSFDHEFKFQEYDYADNEFFYRSDLLDLENKLPFYKKDHSQPFENIIGRSPSKVMRELKNGTFTNYTYNIIDCEYEITEPVYGEVVFNTTTKKYEAFLPETDSLGNKIVYNGGITWVKKTVSIPKSLKKFANSWYNQAINSQYDKVTIDIPTRVGTFKKKGKKLVKLYNFNSLPDAKWKIVLHSFENYIKDDDITNFFKNVENNKYKPGFVENIKESLSGKKPGFVLRFDNPEDQSKFINRIIQYGKGDEGEGKESSASVWFFEGEKEYGTSKIPASVFNAPCYVRYYKNVCEKWRPDLFGRDRLEGYSYTYIPYIYVDLLNATEMIDNLNFRVENNAAISGENQPVHISSAYSAPTGLNAFNPIEKFKAGYTDNIISYKSRKNEKSNALGFWSGIAGAVTGALLMAVFPAAGLLLLLAGSATAIGFAVNKDENQIVIDENAETDADGNKTEINWSSTATNGIDGKGILAGFKGLDPIIETVSIEGHEFSQSIIKLDNNKDTSIESLPQKSITNTYNSHHVEKNLKKFAYMTPLSLLNAEYKEELLPQRLMNAYKEMMTRILFYPEGVDTPLYLDISVPFRNFYSWCVCQKTYLSLAKNIFESVDFSYLKHLILNNVDKCVLKACGLTFEDSNNSYSFSEKDTQHILYNFWIDKAIDLYVYKDENTIKESITTSFTELSNILDLAIEHVGEILDKPSSKFSYTEINNIYSYIKTCEKFNELNNIDIFFFTYINILYFYRLYFVGKRFNKEDGTMWMMRALESVIDLTSPAVPEVPPKSPGEFNPVSSYAVAFYERQNTLDTKREVLIDKEHEPLMEDRVNRIYVKVEWTTEDNWKRYENYVKDPIKNPKAQKVDRFIVNGTTKYALVPDDGLYMFRSKEYDENVKNQIWNNCHKDEVQKNVEDYIECALNINWGDSQGKTPIRWNVFGTVNVDNLLEYSKDSISGRDLVCLMEEGSDFWTIDIPEQLWPRCALFKTGLYIVQVTAAEEDPTKDPYTTVLGPFANTISPVVENKNDPTPNLMEELKNFKGE